MRTELPGPKAWHRKNKDLWLATWNVLSLNRPGAFAELKAQMTKYKIKIAALQETKWKGVKVMDSKGYTMFCSGGNNNTFGTGFLVDKSVKGNVIKFEAVNERLCTLRIRGKFFNITLVNVHAPTEEKDEIDKDNFFELLEKTVNAIQRNDIKIVLGDFNAQIGKEQHFGSIIGKHSAHDNSNDNGLRLIDFAASKNMIISSTMFPHKRIHLVTWHSPSGTVENQIDHVLIDARHASDIINVRSFRGANCDTDHYLVGFKLRQRISLINNDRAKKRTKFNTEKLKDDKCKEEFQKALEQEYTEPEQQTTITHDNIETQWNALRDALVNTAEKVLGPAKINKHVEWYDDECKRKVEERNIARKNMITKKTRSSAIEYSEKRKIAKKECRRKKRKAENERFKSIEEFHEKGETRQVYQHVKEIKKGFQARTNICKDKEDNLIGDKVKIIERWAEYFEQLLNGEEAATAYPEQISALIDQSKDKISDSETKPTIEEVKFAINTMKNNRAPGEDKIPIELIKYGNDIAIDKIHSLIVNIWENEAMPESWSSALICPIHKKGDKMKCENYRGISLLSVPYKIFSKVLAKRLEPLVENVMGEYQCGFRRNRATTDHIFTIRQTLEKCHEYNIPIHQLFIDFKQAYDSINRQKLYETMEYFEIPKKLIRLVKMTLKETKCKVILQSETSRNFLVNKGLRQGDSLSTLLFNLCLEKVIRSSNTGREGSIFTRSSQNLAFADDVDLMARNMKTLTENYTKVKNVSTEFGLVINTDKTKYMTNTKGIQMNNIIEINGDKFEKVNDFKYLGSTITPDDSTSTEIKIRINQANRSYYSIQPILRSSILSRANKIKLYKTMLRPIVMYGSETWKMTTGDKNLLNVWERKILRKIYGAINDKGVWRIRTNNELRKLYKSLSITEEISIQRLRWLGHVTRMDDSRYAKKAMAAQPYGKRKVGRPKKRWQEDVEEDLKHLGVKNWRQKARDREEWRKLLRQAKAQLLGCSARE